MLHRCDTVGSHPVFRKATYSVFLGKHHHQLVHGSTVFKSVFHSTFVDRLNRRELGWEGVQSVLAIGVGCCGSLLHIDHSHLSVRKLGRGKCSKQQRKCSISMSPVLTLYYTRFHSISNLHTKLQAALLSPQTNPLTTLHLHLPPRDVWAEVEDLTMHLQDRRSKMPQGEISLLECKEG